MFPASSADGMHNNIVQNIHDRQEEIIMLTINTKHIALILILAGTVGLLTAPVFAAGDVDLMTKDELKGLLGDDGVIILDVRTGRDWSSSEFKIQGARRADSKDFETWSANLPKGKTLVLYCA